MKKVLIATSTALLLVLSVLMPASAQDADDPGAGPITSKVNACLIAHFQHNDSVCPEPPAAPNDVDVKARVASRLARASFFVNIQEIEKALEEVDAVLAIDPENVPARHLSARIAMVLGDAPRVQRDAAIARERAPDDPAIRTTYAIMLQGKAADYESLAELDTIIAAHPDFMFAHEQRALLAMRFGECHCEPAFYMVALAEYNFVIERSEPSANLFASRARAFLATGHPESAAADLSAALKLDPDRIDLLIARANTYTVAELDEFALKDFNAILAINSGAPMYPMMDTERAKLLMKRAFVFVRLHQFDAAADDAVTALNIGGTSAVLRAEVYLRRNGFPDVPVDGKNSPALRQAIGACFGLNACFQGIIKSI